MSITEKVFTQDMLVNPRKYIPHGQYCHASLENEKECPFWDIDKSKEERDNGYCHYMKKGDWDLHAPVITYDMKTGEKYYSGDHAWGLLWDMCKECDVNMDMLYLVE